jgi:hypothetical protein
MECHNCSMHTKACLIQTLIDEVHVKPKVSLCKA